MTPESITYKPSGIDWLGDIPSHWEVRRLKYCIKGLISGGTPSMDNTEFWQDGHIPWVSPKDMKQDIVSSSEMKITTTALESTNLKLLPPNSILMVVRSGILQRTLPVAITDAETTINQDLKAIILDDDVYLPQYFFQMLKGLEEYILTSCRKAVATVDSIEIPYFLNLPIPVPPLEEQEEIVSFVRDRTERVNAFLSQKQRFIDLLREQKQAIINEAVTKGIYPQHNDNHLVTQGDYHYAEDAPWLDGVPGHWEIRRLKDISLLISKGTTPSTIGRDTMDIGKIRFIKAENIVNDRLVEEPVFYIDEETNDLLQRSQLQVNDLLFVIAGATIGKVAILSATYIPANTNQAVCFIRLNEKVLNKFVWYWLQGYYINQQIWLEANQSAQPNLGMAKIANFKIPVPPLAEQIEIVAYIERETDRVDQLANQAKREMALMQEYRSALVTETVTRGLPAARQVREKRLQVGI